MDEYSRRGVISSSETSLYNLEARTLYSQSRENLISFDRNLGFTSRRVVFEMFPSYVLKLSFQTRSVILKFSETGVFMFID
jgi:hypothetical protein